MKDDLSAELTKARERFLKGYPTAQHWMLSNAWESGAIAVIDVTARRVRDEAKHAAVDRQWDKRLRG